MKKVYAHYRIDKMSTLHHSGGVTVYGEWEPETGKLLAMGAVCTLEDNYNYKRGRVIAKGRFKKYKDVKPSPKSTDAPHQYSGIRAEDGSINIPQQYRVEGSIDVHKCLAYVALDLARYIKPNGEPMSLRRYYRSIGAFEEVTV